MSVTPPSGPSPVQGGPQEGQRAQARVKLNQVARLLTEIVTTLSGANALGSDEGKATVKMLNLVAPVVPDVPEGISASEVASTLSGVSAARPAPAANALGFSQPQTRPMMGASMSPGM